MKKPTLRTVLLCSAVTGAWPAARAAAQESEQPPAPQVPLKRAKRLQTTVGLVPTATDFGSEADMVSSADEESVLGKPKKWTYALKGFLRAPMRIGIGPRNDGTPGQELHSPPRMIGATSNEWTYVGLAPSPTVSLYLSAANANVTGTLILAASTLYDSGYPDLDQMGGISQAYVTISSPELFGNRGGLAWTVGSFSNRYGTAGPRQNSSGYYGTYLFGRTHVAGEALTADVDLSDDLELVVEDGVGAKLEVIPFIALTKAPTAPYFPDQGPAPQGSNFVHHAHAALLVQDWMRIAAHYMTSWSPNDLAGVTGTPAVPARLTVTGGEVHFDEPIAGSAYIGYSHAAASHVLPLADGIQVIHGASGWGFKETYFGHYDRMNMAAPPDDTGTVDTALFQYMLRLAPLLGQSAQGPDVSLSLYGMYNHIAYNAKKLDRVKFGTEIEVSPIRYVSIGARFDRVMPDGHDVTTAYSALSPRVIVHTNFLSREYVIIDYTRFFLGAQARASVPYEALPQADPNLVMLSALLSF